MADIEYSGEFCSQEAAASSESGEIGRIFNLLGGMASLALVVGIGVWGYRLVVRDVSGVPVVRALEGPMRELPEDPGGRQADHQGLAVNAVAAQGTAAAPADRLVLAPRPMELEDEDVPVSGIAPVPAVQVIEAPAAQGRASDAAVMAALVEATDGAGVATVTPAAMTVTAPLAAPVPARPGNDGGSDAAAAEAAGKETTDAVVPTPAVVVGPGPAVSLRPVARPARAVGPATGSGGETAMVTAISAAVDTLAGLEVDPDSLPKGTRMAQLGAYDSAEIARSEWDRLAGRFSDYMAGKQRVVQQASSGGRTFWRLRAVGFEDLSDARRFCSALMAENADCIAVTVR